MERTEDLVLSMGGNAFLVGIGRTDKKETPYNEKQNGVFMEIKASSLVIENGEIFKHCALYPNPSIS